MKGTVDRYVDRVMEIADIRDAQRAAAVRAELLDHLHEKVVSLEAGGYPAAEALVKAVEDHGNPVRIGYSLREWRFLDVRHQGTARGFIAIGPRAVGVIALGGVATGVFAFGGVCFGGVCFGGLALAAMLGWGGVATGLLAYGGLSVGLIAFGGMAIGGVAAGGSAAGLWVPGAGKAMMSYYTWETVPQWLHGVGRMLSFNPQSPDQVASFFRGLNVMSLLTGTVLLLGFAVQLPFSLREKKRVEKISGPVAE